MQCSTSMFSAATEYIYNIFFIFDLFWTSLKPRVFLQILWSLRVWIYIFSDIRVSRSSWGFLKVGQSAFACCDRQLKLGQVSHIQFALYELAPGSSWCSDNHTPSLLQPSHLWDREVKDAITRQTSGFTVTKPTEILINSGSCWELKSWWRMQGEGRRNSVEPHRETAIR